MVNFKKILSVSAMLLVTICISGSLLIPISTASAATIISDGDIVRFDTKNSDGTPTLSSCDVYVVKIINGKKFIRLVINEDVLHRGYYHLSEKTAELLSPDRRSEFTLSSLARLDGYSEVYALAPGGDYGRKSWINMNTNDFLSAGSDPDSVYTINSFDYTVYDMIDEITTVPALQTFYADGSLPGDAGKGYLEIYRLERSADAPYVIPVGVSAEFVKFGAMASNADVVMKSITFDASSIEASADYTAIKDIIVYDSKGQQINAVPVSINADGQATIDFNSYRIAKNSYVTFIVKAKMDKPQQSIDLRINNMDENIKSSAVSLRADFAIMGMDMTAVK